MLAVVYLHTNQIKMQVVIRKDIAVYRRTLFLEIPLCRAVGETSGLSTIQLFLFINLQKQTNKQDVRILVDSKRMQYIMITA